MRFGYGRLPLVARKDGEAPAGRSRGAGREVMTVKDSMWWLYEGLIACGACVAEEIGVDPLDLCDVRRKQEEVQPSPTVPDECGICGGDGAYA